MISYQPLWDLLVSRKVSTYDLIHEHDISGNTIHRVKHGYPITTKTIDKLCSILNCTIVDIVEYIEDKKDD